MMRSIAAITRVTARSGEAGKLVIATFFLSGFLGGVASVAAGVHATTINYQMGHQMGLYALKNNYGCYNIISSAKEPNILNANHIAISICYQLV